MFRTILILTFIAQKGIVIRYTNFEEEKMKKLLFTLMVFTLLIPVALFAEGEKAEGEKAIDEGDELTLYTSLETDETEEYIRPLKLLQA